jgi:hypothetical protein
MVQPMNWNLPKTTSPENIYKFVAQHGIAVIDGFISNKDDLQQAQKELLREVKDDKTYAFGNSARHKQLPNKCTNLNEIINDPRCLEIEKCSGLKRQEVFLSHEYKTGTMARNGFLHFDRMNTFKLFFYLLDTDENCGPFCAIIDTHEKSKELRLKEWSQTKDYSKIKNRPAIDYKDLGYQEEDGDPVVGTAGTLIVFDTDTLHKGGLVKEGRERMVVRTHCR